jgi:NAD(P)-dependent dehydrogenase (short-subunit alcohol dehydrogenase family)
MRLENTSCLVTGGASGLGAATVRALASRGAKVAALDVNEAQLSAITTETQCLPLLCDIRDEAQVVGCLDSLATHQGDARILVQCAGIAVGERVVNRKGEPDIASFRRTIDTNLIGTYTVMSHIAARMARLDPLEDGERGVIINTASIAVEDGQVGQCAYSASKGGVAALALPAARELGRFGIRISTIAPGLFATPMMDALPQETQDRLAQLPAFPKRLGHAAEYAALALHIAENVMINAQMFRLDAGVRLELR